MGTSFGLVTLATCRIGLGVCLLLSYFTIGFDYFLGVCWVLVTAFVSFFGVSVFLFLVSFYIFFTSFLASAFGFVYFLSSFSFILSFFGSYFFYGFLVFYCFFYYIFCFGSIFFYFTSSFFFFCFWSRLGSSFCLLSSYFSLVCALTS